MKKKLVIFLVLIFSISSVFAQGLYEENIKNAPNIGNKINNFTVKDIREFDMIGSTAYLFEHNKTGAQVLYLKNDDINRVFEISFKTPALSDTGIPHVFEHATLSGSEKYPSKSLFFNLSYQTFNTYMNASTSQFLTSYPVASLSEDELLKLADFYLDSCFNPLALRDKSIFDREAWRYELKDMDSELEYKGTVYSEMLGANTLERSAYFNNYKSAFPGSIIGNDSGGKPDAIINMTHEDIIDYHNKYYTPSNSLTVLYGKLDNYDYFLKLLDSYFSQYKKTRYNFTDANYKQINGFVRNEYVYPVESTSNTDNSCVAYYTFVCHDTTEDDVNVLMLMSELVGNSSSVLVENMKNRLPNVTLVFNVDFNGPETALSFIGNGLKKEEVDTFKEVIDSSLLQMYAQGFDEDMISGIISNIKIEMLLTSEVPDLGIAIIPGIARYWTKFGNAFGYSDYIDSIMNFRDYVDNGRIAEVFIKYLISNPDSSLSSTYSVAGLKEEETNKRKTKLSAIKDSMSIEELEQIIYRTNNADPQEDNSEYIKELSVTTVDNLPEEYKDYEVTVTNLFDSTIKHYFAKADVTDVSIVRMMFDASGLDKDKIHFFNLYTDLMGELDTANYTRAELLKEMNKYAYNCSFSISTYDTEDKNSTQPVLLVKFTALDENLEKAYELLYEALYDSILDADRVYQALQNRLNQYKIQFQNNMYNIQVLRLAGITSPSTAYLSYAFYLEYYEFIKQMIDLIDQGQIDYIISELDYIKNYFKNSYNLILAVAGNEESDELNLNEFTKFISKLGYNEIEDKEITLPLSSGEEAIITDSNIQYHAFFTDAKSLGIDKVTADYSVIASIISDKLLFPVLRDQMGVYTPIHGYLEDYGMYIITYRDPNDFRTTASTLILLPVTETLESIDQKTLDGYILSTYSNLITPKGELTGAVNKITDMLNHKDKDRTLVNMKKLKELKVDNLTKYADVYANFLNSVTYSSSGSSDKFDENDTLFSPILNPFKVIDKSSVIFTDVDESNPLYEEIMYVYVNGFMDSTSNTEFGTKKPVTTSELAVIICTVLGVNNITEEQAVQILNQAGVLPEGASEELTADTLYEYCVNFCDLIGQDSSIIPIPMGATKADVAHILYSVFN